MRIYLSSRPAAVVVLSVLIVALSSLCAEARCSEVATAAAAQRHWHHTLHAAMPHPVLIVGLLPPARLSAAEICARSWMAVYAVARFVTMSLARGGGPTATTSVRASETTCCEARAAACALAPPPSLASVSPSPSPNHLHLSHPHPHLVSTFALAHSPSRTRPVSTALLAPPTAHNVDIHRRRAVPPRPRMGRYSALLLAPPNSTPTDGFSATHPRQTTAPNDQQSTSPSSAPLPRACGSLPSCARNSHTGTRRTGSGCGGSTLSAPRGGAGAVVPASGGGTLRCAGLGRPSLSACGSTRQSWCVGCGSCDDVGETC